MGNFVENFLKVKMNYIYHFCFVINVEYIVTEVKLIGIS